MKCFESDGPADVEINQLTNLLVDLSERAEALRGYL
jgi:hypothetical protein